MIDGNKNNIKNCNLKKKRNKCSLFIENSKFR